MFPFRPLSSDPGTFLKYLFAAGKVNSFRVNFGEFFQLVSFCR